MIYICVPYTKERIKQTDRLLASIRKNTDIPHCVVLYQNEDGGWVKAMHSLLEGIDDHVILLGSDTIVYPNWLSTLKEAHERIFPNDDGVVEPYNELHKGKLVQHPYGQASVIKKYLDKDFIHCFSDNWMHDRLTEKNLYAYVPESVIEHLHWVNGKAQIDDSYRMMIATSNIDKETYIKKTNKLKNEKNRV